ncbi:MAG TPA: hypothetical protein VF240_20050 [Pyrinomonadaceae bacterium]
MRAREGRLILYFVIAAAALLLAACGKNRAGQGGGGGGGSVAAPAAGVLPVAEATAPKRTLAPLPARELTPELRSARARAMADASRLRGLAWRGEVGMTPLSAWEFGTRAAELADALGAEDLQTLGRLAVAGGILPPGTDLAATAVGFTAATAGAFYSPLDRQVIVRAEGTGSAAAKKHALLTHEFVHALQDQHFDLLGLLLAKPYNFDRAEAAFALVEGDATVVQRRVEQGDAFARRTLEEVARAEDARFDSYRREVGWLFPALLTETFVFRYRDGARFVETLRRGRPAMGADELFRRPPVSTEQVLHPEKYLAGEAPREVSLNVEGLTNDGWRASGSTPLGEIGVRGLLLGRVAAARATRAAAGWGGDLAGLFEREGHAPLFVWKSVWDTAADAREFFAAYGAPHRRAGASTQTREEVWREGAALTLVRLEGDAVLVIRGAEDDVRAAARMF